MQSGKAHLQLGKVRLFYSTSMRQLAEVDQCSAKFNVFGFLCVKCLLSMG